MRTQVRLLSFLLLAGGCHSLYAAQQPAILPELNFKRLLNDLQIVVGTASHLGDAMTVGVMVRYGSAFDPAEKGGLAYVVSRLIGKASLDRSAKDIQTELELLGATLDARSDWDGIRVTLQCQSASYERALLLLYQVVGEAVFNEEDVNRARQQVLTELESPEDPRQKIHRQFEEVLFRGTTYGRAARGTRSSLGNITVGDVRLFHRRYFAPNAAALVVVGSTAPAEILPKATRIWGVWVKKDDVPFSFMPARRPGARNIYFEDDPASPAAQFVAGNLWPRRDDVTYYPAMLGARVLQQRLTQVLPTSLVTVAAEGRRMPGPFYLQGQAAADQAVAQIEKMLDTVEGLKGEGVTPEELAEAQKRWIEDFARLHSSTAGICGVLMDAELYRLGVNYETSFPELVRRQNVDSVRNVAKEWLFPGGVVLLVRGPASILLEPLQRLGSVQRLPP